MRVPAPLAWVWGLLPRGPVAWAIPGLLLAALAAATVATRRRDRFRGVPLGLVALLVAAGLTVGSRDAWSTATEPPADARAEGNPVPGSAESVERGQDLYLANCASCHGTGGAGDGPAAEGMLPSPGDLASSVPAQTDGGLAYLVAVGIAGTDMPPFADVLSPVDRWDLVNYLRASWPGR
jgi:mono/diheme cytochrome c family protein